MTTRSRTRALAALLLVAAVGLACGFVRDARTVVDSATVLGEFADALGRAPTYTAEYSTSGGKAVTLVQDPPRAAYLVTGGRLIATPDSLILCEADSCRRAPNHGARTDADTAHLVAAVTGPGFVTPEEVLAMIAAAAFTRGTKVDLSTRTIAGRPVLCGDVKGLEAVTPPGQETLKSFSVCVTDEGVVASFAGTPSTGAHGTMELRSVSGTVDAAALAPPAGASVADVPSLR